MILTFLVIWCKIRERGVIAQLIRALPLQGRGPVFESLLLYQFGDIAQLVRARH